MTSKVKVERNSDDRAGSSFGGSMVTSFTQTTPHKGGRIRRQRIPKLVEQAINTEEIVLPIEDLIVEVNDGPKTIEQGINTEQIVILT